MTDEAASIEGGGALSRGTDVRLVAGGASHLRRRREAGGEGEALDLTDEAEVLVRRCGHENGNLAGPAGVRKRFNG